MPGAQLRRVAKTLATNKPGTVIWCMGGTQHTVGNANVRAYCILQLALGNMGVAGGGTNIFRGHDNVQGATDFGVEPGTLPGYYGLAEGAWKHWARVWDVPYDWMLARFKDKKLMEEAGIPLSRWADGVLEAKENVEQPDTLKAVFFWGHAPNSQTRGPDLKKAFEKLDMLVIVDPHPTVSAVLHDRTDGVYLLPAATQYETVGSVTASNRSLQWREKVFGPFFEAKSDHEIMYLLAKKLGFDKEMFKKIKVEKNEPVVEDITREFNKGMWTIGYTGQSPERLKLHMANQHTFDRVTLKANGGPCDGDYYGLPWPCWGTAAIKHPGTPNLYDTSKPVSDGGLNFRVNWGLTVKGQANDKWSKNDPVADSLLAVDSYPVGAEIKDGHPPVTMGLLHEDGLGQGPHPRGARHHQEDRRRQARERGVDRRQLGRHPARGDQARHRPVRQRQGALRRLELPGRRAAAPRAALHGAPRSAAEVCDPPGSQAQPAAAAVRLDPGQGRLQGLPDRADLGPSGGVRGRRRGAALQPVARRAAAEHVRGDQPQRRQQPRHQGRPAGVGGGAREGQGPRHGDGDGAGRQGRRLHAVPLRRPLPGQGPAIEVSRGHRPHRAR